MEVIIFLIIITALVFAHELGHFLIAKLFKMRVDEFAIGFPPRLLSFKAGGTVYSINLLPLGGFVKIFGENHEDVEENTGDGFSSKPRYAQVLVLIAGIVFNILFAWVLFSTALIVGAPAQADLGSKGAELMISDVLSGSPAEIAGIKSGDVVKSINVSGSSKIVSNPSTDDIKNVLSGSNGKEIDLDIVRNGKDLNLKIEPTKTLSAEKGNFAIGIEMIEVSVKKLGFFPSIVQGGQATINTVETTTVSIWGFLAEAIHAKADLSQVSGPVGIVSIVGSAAQFGFGYLLSFSAVISINLAVINLIPFPALDGGRIFIVIIEAIRRKSINANITNIINMVGFFILIAFMIVITYSDLSRIFGW